MLILVAAVSMPREKRQKLSQDVPADSSPPVLAPRGRLGKEKVGDFFSGSQIPIHSRKAGSIVIRDAPRSPSPAASESDDGGNKDEPGSESNPLRLYKTRAVDPDPRRPRVNYLKNLLKCGKHRMYSWNEEVTGQFYSTAFFGTTKKGLDFVKWTIQGQQYRVSMAQFAAALGLDDDDLSRPHIFVEDALSPTSTTFLYEKDAPKDCLGTTRGLRPYYRVLYSIFRWSLLPKVGDATALPGRHAL
uniref:OSJNBa0042N22.3 protein n=1 Tax=Oryza sativa subsp. japonica TaxID=39947 RepID=Q7XXM4_ORYSJ|nr:OSJNBa0042N22.3 [Oryza sativa Japonica Group]